MPPLEGEIKEKQKRRKRMKNVNPKRTVNPIVHGGSEVALKHEGGGKFTP